MQFVTFERIRTETRTIGHSQAGLTSISDMKHEEKKQTLTVNVSASSSTKTTARLNPFDGCTPWL
jgi:hypothetical protein